VRRRRLGLTQPYFLQQVEVVGGPQHSTIPTAGRHTDHTSEAEDTAGPAFIQADFCGECEVARFGTAVIIF
jgi:hypothetical protein